MRWPGANPGTTRRCRGTRRTACVWGFEGTDYKYSNRWLARDNPTFLFGSQVLDNFFWTVASAVPILDGL